MDRRTALFALPSVLSALTIARQPAADHSAFDRCYQRYAEARAVADDFLATDDDTDDQAGTEIFSRLSKAAKALICEPAPTLDALNKKLGCFYTEEMYLGITFGKQAAHTLANDSRRLVGLQELEPVDFDDRPGADESLDEYFDRPEPQDPGFSADEFAERKFREIQERYPDSWRLQSFGDYERLNDDLYAVYSVSIDRRFLAQAGERLESAMDNHGVQCWGLGKYGGDPENGFAFVTVLFMEASAFEVVKDRFRINAQGRA